MSYRELWPAWATEAVEIVAPDAGWALHGEGMAARLGRLLAPWRTRRVEHVGSTAVPGLAAKPILDLQAAVRDLDLDLGAGVVEALAPDGWQLVPPELDARPWRRLFVLPRGDRRAAHLHLLAEGGSRWHDQLLFRDALCADPGLRDTYARLKSALAAAHPDGREAYTQGKSAFVRRVLDEARDGTGGRPECPPNR